jgi:serine/threonine-protein kinase
VKPRLEDSWRAVDPYLTEMLSLEPALRTCWLDTLAEREPDMAAQLRACLGELEQLDQQGFLATPPVGAPPCMALSGQRMGAYTLDRTLGHGGMGTVWLAHRNDGRFEGCVAMKLLNTALIGQPAERRFVREGSVLAKLQHPNIARLLDAGIADHGQPYLVLELVEGIRIDHYCDGARLSVEQRLALFDQVLDAVAHAHNHLVVHSDLKPANILVTSEGVVKLLDFGIAKLLREESEDSTILGYRALTPEYAAPEQLHGGEISTATDVYSLGVLLYELLCGRHPTHSLPAPPAVEQAEPQPLSTLPLQTSVDHGDAYEIAAKRGTTLARLRLRLQGDLEHIVARALQARAAQRYPTVAAFAADLQRHLNHYPVQARPGTRLYRSSKFLRRYRSTLLAASLVLMAVVGGALGTITQARRAQREADNAKHQLVAAESKSELFNFLVYEGFGRSVPVAELLGRAEHVVQHQFGSDAYATARLNMTLADLHAEAGNAERASQLRRQTRSLVRGLPDVSLRADVDCTLGRELRDLGRYDEARVLFDQAIVNTRRARRPEDPTILPWCLVQRSWLNAHQGDQGAALIDARAALAAVTPPRLDQRMLVVQVKAALANASSMAGDYAAAAREYRGALAELAQLGRDTSGTGLWLLEELGGVLFEVGEVSAAGEVYERALRIGALRGTARAGSMLAGRRGRLLLEVGSTSDATVLLTQASILARASNDTFHAALFDLYGAMARCTLELATCEMALLQARSALGSALPAGHARFGAWELASARLALARGDAERARVALREALVIFTTARDRGPFHIKALALLARTELQLGERAAAHAHAHDAVARARALMLGFDHSAWLGDALLVQGLVQNAQGAPTEARESWAEAYRHLQSTVGVDGPAAQEARELLAL